MAAKNSHFMLQTVLENINQDVGISLDIIVLLDRQ